MYCRCVAPSAACASATRSGWKSAIRRSSISWNSRRAKPCTRLLDHLVRGGVVGGGRGGPGARFEAELRAHPVVDVRPDHLGLRVDDDAGVLADGHPLAGQL